jgi:hypothetical protein
VSLFIVAFNVSEGCAATLPVGNAILRNGRQVFLTTFQGVIDLLDTHVNRVLESRIEEMCRRLTETALYDIHIGRAVASVPGEVLILLQVLVALPNVFRYLVQVIGERDHYGIENCCIQPGTKMERLTPKMRYDRLAG